MAKVYQIYNYVFLNRGLEPDLRCVGMSGNFLIKLAFLRS